MTESTRGSCACSVGASGQHETRQQCGGRRPDLGRGELSRDLLVQGRELRVMRLLVPGGDACCGCIGCFCGGELAL